MQQVKYTSPCLFIHVSFCFLDFSELIHALTEHPGRMVKCRGLRNVYASRACRKSKMFGDPLSYKEMVQVMKWLFLLQVPVLIV